MLKFKDFKCASNRSFWTGNIDMSKDEAVLFEINSWLRGKAFTVINVETLSTNTRASPIIGRLVRVWFTE